MKIKWLIDGHEPYLVKGLLYEVIGFYRKQPIVRDHYWHINLRLNVKKSYQLIED